MIEITNVNFHYAGLEQAGVKDINLCIPDGECLLLCGASGCGKTTITRLINGLIPHFYKGELSGKVMVNGRKINEQQLYDLAQVVGSVFQNPRSQFFSVDTDGEVVFGPENIGLSKDEILNRKDMVLHELNLLKLMQRSLFDLSGGEKQKIACGSVAALLPDIILLDEPSSNLDWDSIKDLANVIRLWKSQGKTVIIPYLFIGHADTDASSVFVNANVSSYTPESNISSRSGVIDFFADDAGQGLIKGVSRMARRTADNTTKTQTLIAGNLIDLKTVYMDTLNLHKNGTNVATKSWINYLENGQIRKNQFYKRGTTAVINGSAILDTEITEKISVDNLKKEVFGDYDDGENFHISDVLVDGYEFGAFFANNNSVFDSTIIRDVLTDNDVDLDNLTPEFVSAYLNLFQSWLHLIQRGGRKGVV